MRCENVAYNIMFSIYFSFVKCYLFVVVFFSLLLLLAFFLLFFGDISEKLHLLHFSFVNVELYIRIDAYELGIILRTFFFLLFFLSMETTIFSSSFQLCRNNTKRKKLFTFSSSIRFIC